MLKEYDWKDSYGQPGCLALHKNLRWRLRAPHRAGSLLLASQTSFQIFSLLLQQPCQLFFQLQTCSSLHQVPSSCPFFPPAAVCQPLPRRAASSCLRLHFALYFIVALYFIRKTHRARWIEAEKFTGIYMDRIKLNTHGTDLLWPRSTSEVELDLLWLIDLK